MTIRFRCRGCKKVLAVKDELAGKKVTCPGCKNPVIIPNPKKETVAIDPNIEELAASALAGGEEPPPEEKPPERIPLTCPFCEEEVFFEAELGGKRAPCPQCTRILKVPQLASNKPKDWRDTTRQGPLVATMRQQAKEMEGVWDSTGNQGIVHRESLEEAEAIPTAKEPTPLGTKIKRALMGLGATLAVGLGIWFLASFLNRTRLEANIQEALDSFKMASKDMSRGWQAEFHRGLGNYYVRALQPQEALAQFRKARFQFPAQPAGKEGPTPEEELLLIDLALAQVGLGGEEKEIILKQKLPWVEVSKEIERSIAGIPSVEGKVMALRRLTPLLIQLKQGTLALGLATQFNPNSKGGADAETSPLAGMQAAILLALEQPEAARQLVPLPNPQDKEKNVGLGSRLGYSQGKAWLGQFAEARQIAAMPGNAQDRLVALLGVAEIALQQSNGEEAKPSYQDALKIVREEYQKKKLSPLTAYLLGYLAGELETSEDAKAVISLIGESGCQARAELDRQKKQTRTAGVVDHEALGSKGAIAMAQAYELAARQRAIQGKQAELLASLTEADPPLKPFIYLGKSLAVQK